MSSTPPAPTGVTIGPIDPTTFDPNAAAYIADPYPTYGWFRDNLPVAELSLVPGKLPPSYWVFRDEDVRTILNAPDVFRKHANGPGAPPQLPAPPVFWSTAEFPPGLLSSDPPRHKEIRDAVEPSFTDAIADAHDLATHAVTTVLAGLADTRRFELVGDVAAKVPSIVLAEVLGLPTADLAVLDGWVDSIITAHNVTQKTTLLALGGTCSMALRAYYDGLVIANRSQPSGGMLSGVCDRIGEGIDERDVQSVMSDMLIAGFKTTAFLISTGMRSLMANPEQADLLRSDPSLLDGAVDEMLRFDAPAQLLDRQVAEPVVLGGVALQPGARIVPAVGSANRDGSVYPDPDTFDIRRPERTQLGFGGGIHHCIGAPLARMVVPAAISGLLHLDGIRIDGTPQWQPDPYLRGLTSLPMAYD
jgi:cytochrome P450